jgi:hypothetical protein
LSVPSKSWAKARPAIVKATIKAASTTFVFVTEHSPPKLEIRISNLETNQNEQIAKKEKTENKCRISNPKH